jgi:hypothetical protein
VAAPEDAALVHEDGADGDPAFAKPKLRLLDRRSHELV